MLRWEAAVTVELKRWMLIAGTLGGSSSSLNITNIDLLNRFNETREIFHSVNRVLNILLTTAEPAQA